MYTLLNGFGYLYSPVLSKYVLYFGAEATIFYVCKLIQIKDNEDIKPKTTINKIR